MNNYPFHMQKWYLDVVDDNHNTSIFYSARLNWYGLTFQYIDWIHYDGKNVSSLKRNFRSVACPEQTDSAITWEDRKLDVNGKWMAMTDSLNARIYDSPNGFLDWNCHQPGSMVKLNHDNKTVRGLGYAEMIDLTVYPWKIPMDHLRWGRYVSSRNTLVWIQLLGETNRQWAWLNGTQIDPDHVDDISLNHEKTGTKLDLEKLVVLQSGKPISKALSEIMRAVTLYNSSIRPSFFNAQSMKWLSKGSLKTGGNKEDTGMVIHEWVNLT